MKIAIIGQKGISSTTGGVERHVASLAVRLGEMGNDVTVYTRAWFAPPTRRFARGVRTVATPTVRSKHFDTLLHSFTSTLHATLSGADVIHYHGEGPALFAWIPRLFAPRTKVVATFHSINRKQRQRWGIFARFVFWLGEIAITAFPHETIVVSRTLQAYCADRYNRETRYIPNGIDAPHRAGTSVLTEYDLEHEGYFLFVGRLVPSKNVHMLIEAFIALKKQGALRRVQGRRMKLVIVGGSAYTDRYVESLHRLATGHVDIIFTGFVSGKRLAELYANSFASVHPSEAEGLPIVPLEAMSHGKAVIAADIPENMEVVRDFGLHFTNRSVVDLARKMRWAVAHPVKMRALGRAARAHVLSEYRWDAVAREVNGVYASLVHVPKRRHAVA